MRKNKKKNEFRVIIKFVLCLIYSAVALILFSSAFRIYQQKNTPMIWDRVTSTNDYAYIQIDKMSEKFATIDKDKNIHFIIDEDNKTGLWHVYLVAIKKDDYPKYQNIINYTYGKTKNKDDDVIAYGYPREISNELKELTIKNYKNFVSFQNQVELTTENFETYVTNTYLDTTIKQKNPFNWLVVIILLLEFVLVGLIIATILDKDKIVDEVDKMIEKEEKKHRKK